MNNTSIVEVMKAEAEKCRKSIESNRRKIIECQDEIQSSERQLAVVLEFIAKYQGAEKKTVKPEYVLGTESVTVTQPQVSGLKKSRVIVNKDIANTIKGALSRNPEGVTISELSVSFDIPTSSLYSAAYRLERNGELGSYVDMQRGKVFVAVAEELV